MWAGLLAYYMETEHPMSIEKSDVMEYLKKIGDNVFPMSFADPPFNLGKKYDATGDSLGDETYWKWCEAWIKELVRVTKPGGSVFIHHIPAAAMKFGPMLEAAGCRFKSWIAWKASSGPMGKYAPQPDNYPILYYVKNGGKQVYNPLRVPNKRCRNCGYLHKDYGGKKITIPAFGPLMSDVWDDIHRVKHKTTRVGTGRGEWLHPCVLPVPVMERLILMCTQQDDWVLDAFMGSGTTAAACKRLNRDPHGCDISPKYVAEAKRRYNHEKVTRIANRPVSIFRGEIQTVLEEDLEAVCEAMKWPVNKIDLDFACPVLDHKKRMVTKPKVADADCRVVAGKPPYSITAGTKDNKKEKVECEDPAHLQEPVSRPVPPPA